MHTFKEFRRQSKEARVVGNETRMKTLSLLFLNPRCVKELAEMLHIRAVNPAPTGSLVCTDGEEHHRYSEASCPEATVFHFAAS